MNQSIISVRVDSKDKKAFEEFCNKTGMNVSTAINMFIKNVLAEHRMPFQVKLPKLPKELEEKILEAEADFERNPRLYSAEEVYEHFKDLLDS